MALDISFLHFTTKASYTAERSRNESSGTLAIFDGYISFVDEGPTIYTRGKEYKCSVDKSLVENLIDSAGHATVSQLEGYLPLTGGTMSGSIKFSESVNNILSILTEDGEQSLININDSNLWFGHNNTIINKTIIKVGSSGLEVVRPSESNTAIVYDSRNLTKLSQLQNDLNLDFVPNNIVGVAGGIATLDNNGLVPASQLPSFVDDVLEYNTLDDFPIPGETGKIYVAKDTNLSYRWGETQYVEISKSIALANTVTGNDTALTASRSDHNHNSTYVTLATTQSITGAKTFTLNNGAIVLTTRHGTYLEGKTYSPIKLSAPQSASFQSLINVTLNNGDTVALAGIDNQFGFTLWKANRTEDGVDGKIVIQGGDSPKFLVTIPLEILNKTSIQSSEYNGLIIKRNAIAGSSILFTNSNGNLGKVGFTSEKIFTVSGGTTTDGVADLLGIEANGKATFSNDVTAPEFIGSLQGNASSATKLATTITLWGKVFDGSKDISGTLTNTGSVIPSQNDSFNIGADNLRYHRVYSTYFSSGLKNVYNDGKRGVWINNDGKIYLQGSTQLRPTIYFDTASYTGANYLAFMDTYFKFSTELRSTGDIKIEQVAGSGTGFALHQTFNATQYGMFLGTTAKWGLHGSVTGDWATYFTIQTTGAPRGWIFKNTSTSTNVASISSDGDITVANIFKGINFTTSDIKLKTNIEDVDKNTIYKSLEISPLKSWNYKKDGTYAIGRIAQDVQKVLPKLVTTQNDILYVDKESLLELEIEGLNLKVNELTKKLNELTNEKFEWQ